jgi:hypothetical protein
MEPVEVFEHIPWTNVAAPRLERKPWLVYLVAGAVAAAAVGALIARSVVRPSDAPAASIAPATTTPTVDTSPATVPAIPDQVSEADLLAVAPGQRELAAAARAEWFVVDYFSSGGDPGEQQSVRDALPEGSRVPDLPEQASSYVDWAATSRIEALGDHRFRSTVLFRLLVAGVEGNYRRSPVQAVEVVVEVDPHGATRVVDLPMPAEIGRAPAVPGWSEPSQVMPDVVRESALRLAGSWGESPVVLEGGEMDGGWRVVVEASDPAGVRWPLTVWLTELGEPFWTP